MISKVKDDIRSLLGFKINFRYNGSRNQIEEFEGVIINVYNYVFLIDVDGFFRSFSYADVLTGTLEINV